MAQLREPFLRAAADAGMSRAQMHDAFQHAHVTIKTGRSAVYPGRGGPQSIDAQAGPPPVGSRLAEPPRRIPAVFGLAELLPFRWRYVWLPSLIGIAPIALWMSARLVFPMVAVFTMAAIYAFNLWGASKRFALLRWGQVADVTGSEIISEGTYYSGTTYSGVRLPVARGWRVQRPWYSGPNTKTRIRDTLNGTQGELRVSGCEYIDGVVLADSRNPARGLCVTSFPYDLDRDEWLVTVIGWLGLAAVVATKDTPTSAWSASRSVGSSASTA